MILEDAEKGVTLHPVGWDALVVIVNKSNSVQNISIDQLKAVFFGEVTNWKQLGGNDEPIAVLAREGKISGVGMMARELIFGDADIEFKSTHQFKSTGPIEEAVLQMKNAIALDGVSSARKRDLKILDLNGIAPTVENIASGAYKLFRPLYLVTAQKMTPEVSEFIKFVKSPEGQRVIANQLTVTLAKGGHLWHPYRKHMRTVRGEKKRSF